MFSQCKNFVSTPNVVLLLLLSCSSCHLSGYKFLLPTLSKTPDITKRGSSAASMQKVLRSLHEVLHCDKVLFLANSSDKSALHYAIEAVRKHNNMKISMTTKFPGSYENHRPQTAPSEAMPVIIPEIGENGTFCHSGEFPGVLGCRFF